MSILINRSTRVVVQGITGKAGTFFTKDMIQYGTKIAAGVTPGKGGATVEGVPVFDSVLDAVEKEAAEVSIIFIPAALGPGKYSGGHRRRHKTGHLSWRKHARS